MAGYASVLRAWLSGDLGQLGAADSHARAGAMFAGTSGSVELQAWVQAVRSKTAFWLGDYRDAAELATAGLEAAPATSVRVLLAAQVADAWSISWCPGSSPCRRERGPRRSRRPDHGRHHRGTLVVHAGS
jgi:hypothetical protein